MTETRSYPMIILLHGFGAHMGDLASLAPAIDPTGYVYIFPNAPIPFRDRSRNATGYRLDVSPAHTTGTCAALTT